MLKFKSKQIYYYSLAYLNQVDVSNLWTIKDNSFIIYKCVNNFL